MLTCRSCQHYRTTECAKRRMGYPTASLAACSSACYEPGSDEAEDRDQDTDTNSETQA